MRRFADAAVTPPITAPAARSGASLGKRLVRATIGSAGIRMLGMAFTFLVGVQLARYLGPDGFGVYGTVMAIGALLVVPAQLGLPQLITREISTYESRGDAAATKSVLLWFPVIVLAASVVLTLAACLVLAAWPGVDPTYRTAFYWGMAAIPFFTLLNLASGALRGLHHVVAAQVFDALLRPMLYAGLLALAVASFGVLTATEALGLQALAAFCTVAACLAYTLKQVPRATAKAKTAPFRRGMAASAPSMLGTELLRVLDGQYAILLLGTMAALSDVGHFRVAVAIAGFVGLPSTLINLVIMSSVAELNARGDQRRLQLIATYSALGMFVTIATITLGLFLWGEAFIGRVFGNAFVPAWMPLMVMAAAYGVSAFFGAAATILNMMGQERTVLFVHLVGPSVGIVLTLVLYERFGILAPAIAMLVAELIKGCWMAVAARRHLGLDVTVISANALAARARAHAST